MKVIAFLDKYEYTHKCFNPETLLTREFDHTNGLTLFPHGLIDEKDLDFV